MQAGWGGGEEAAEARQAGLELRCEREEATAAGARCEAERATADSRSGKGGDRARRLGECEWPGRGCPRQQAGGNVGLREGRRLEGMGSRTPGYQPNPEDMLWSHNGPGAGVLAPSYFGLLK